MGDDGYVKDMCYICGHGTIFIFFVVLIFQFFGDEEFYFFSFGDGLGSFCFLHYCVTYGRELSGVVYGRDLSGVSYEGEYVGVSYAEPVGVSYTGVSFEVGYAPCQEFDAWFG